MLELEPQARAQLRELMYDFRQEARPLQDQITHAEDSIALLLDQDPVPVETMELLFRRISDLRISVNRMALQRLVASKSFLTPEQQRAFFRAVMEARPRMGGRGWGGRGPMLGPDSGGGRPFGPEGRMRRNQPPLD
jgi:Spy/CpxP family protein refolding chaperone